MHDFLKETLIYKIFLRIRTKIFTNENLRIQLSKRGHNLDKAISENIDDRPYLFEVELLLKEYHRRKLKPINITKWAWDLVYKAKFDVKDSEGENKEILSDDSYKKTDFAKIIKSRRSVRKWEAKKVDIKDIIESIDLAKWAPSSCNRQLWKFLVISKEEDKDFLQIFTSQSFYKKAPIVIVSLVNITGYNKDEKNYAYLDMGAIIQNLLLILHFNGLGACWTGIKHTKDYEKGVDKLRSRFNLEKNLIPVSFISVGKCSKIPKAPPRKDIEEIIKII